MLPLILLSPAHATCPQPYTGEQLVQDMTVLQTALRNLDEATFTGAGNRLEAGLPCVGNPVPAPVFATAYRYLGAHRYFQGDEDEARRWFRIALELDPSYEWDAQELDLGNPMRTIFEDERSTAKSDPVSIDKKILAQPAGSRLVLDGRPLDKAAATMDRPHVLQQIATSDRGVRGTWLIDGNGIPMQFLADPVVATETDLERKAREKKEKEDKKKVTSNAYGDKDVTRVDRMRPPEKTPLMVAGAVGILAAGGIYAYSFKTQSDFENARTTEELLQQQSLTNTLVLASGGVFLAGLGVGYWGLILDGGAGVGIVAPF